MRDPRPERDQAATSALAATLILALAAIAGCVRALPRTEPRVADAAVALVAVVDARRAPDLAVCEGSGVSVPARESPVRKAVVEVVRAHLATRLDFKVERLVVVRDWAYFEAVELTDGGRHVAALLRRLRGAWTAASVLTAPATEDVLPLRQRLRADPRRPPPPLFGVD